VLLLFFFWPAAQALVEAVHLSDAFGGSRRFVGLENFRQILANPGCRASVLATAAFTAATTALALGMGLLFAVLVDRVARGLTAYRTFVIWPYAVAPAVAGVLWWFLFNPTVGVVPLSVTNVAALGVILFVYGWNQYLWPLLVTTDPEMSTAVLGVTRLMPSMDSTPEWNVVMAAALVAMLPPVAVVVLLQRWFLRGLIEPHK
jgi:ABC-type sugar transport system permease subunit